MRPFLTRVLATVSLAAAALAASASPALATPFGFQFAGTLPRQPDHRMMDFPALRTEWPCESPGSRKVRSSAF